MSKVLETVMFTIEHACQNAYLIVKLQGGGKGVGMSFLNLQETQRTHMCPKHIPTQEEGAETLVSLTWSQPKTLPSLPTSHQLILHRKGILNLIS